MLANDEIGSNIRNSDVHDLVWMYKRGASPSAMLGSAKMVGNNGLGLPTFGDSFLQFLKTLGF